VVENIEGVIITPLNIIEVKGGDVMHAMKKTDAGFDDFGEAYFSKIEKNFIKAWKLHQSMTLNLVVPFGEVKFVLFDQTKFQEVILSKNNFARLTIPPGIWFGFQGLHEPSSIVLNLANLVHNEEEVVTKELNYINYKW
jgi:dTDP-4-dehydrorhamnose 3,5-epimerase|tara:strand:+ start:282 stop:698 length:417 start_codon:yes stop_codon:yes gene_type:complete